MQFIRFVTPAIAGIAVVVAYLGGQYVGTHDENKRQSIVSEQVYALESADKLLIFHHVATFLRESKTSEALLTSDQFAQLQVGTVSKCLSDAACTSAIGSPERQTELREIVRIRSQLKTGS